MDSADSGSEGDRTEAEIREHATQPGGDAEPLVLPLAAVGLEAIASVGGKNASLGEMIRTLGASGVRVPEGFATSAAAYRLFLASNGLEPPLRAILEGLDTADLAALHAAGQAARALLLAAPLPARLEQEIRIAYRALGAPAVAVRSSATAEDLPNASFAGQQETFLHIEGEADLLEACRRCYASLFTDRALSYRQLNGFDHLEVALSIGVQRMVAADRACSGVMFSIDTETGFRDAVLLTAAYGLGETVVQGAVTPDEWPRVSGRFLAAGWVARRSGWCVPIPRKQGGPCASRRWIHPIVSASPSATRRCSPWPAGR